MSEIRGKHAEGLYQPTVYVVPDVEKVWDKQPKSYYTTPDGVQVSQITRWLGSNSGQAVQYICRSGWLADNYKSDSYAVRISDYRKAIDFLEDEIERLQIEEEQLNA